MSKTKKYYFYLNSDKEEQITAIHFLDKLEKGKRSDTIKDVILAGFSLRNIDERLPKLIASLLKKQTSLKTLSRLIGVLDSNYSECIREISSNTEVVAWQKRVIDKLSPSNTWSTWISITKNEYNELLTKNNELIQVRALIGSADGDQVGYFNSNDQYNSKKIDNTLINKAKNLFGSDGF